MLYIQTQPSALARHFSAPKRTNVPASAFHKPLDLPLECQQYYPPRPSHRHRSLIRAEGMAGAPRVKSPDAKVPAMYPATETPKRQRKTLEAIDGVRKQISDPTVGQRLKVADRNHSASTSPASQMLISLLGKVSPLGIFKVSAVNGAARGRPREAHLEAPSRTAELVNIAMIKYCSSPWFVLLNLEGISQI